MQIIQRCSSSFLKRLITAHNALLLINKWQDNNARICLKSIKAKYILWTSANWKDFFFPKFGGRAVSPCSLFRKKGKKKILVALKMHEQIRGSLQMLPITWKLIRTVWPWVWVDSTEAGTQSRPERKETVSDADNEAVSSGYCNQVASLSGHAEAEQRDAAPDGSLR